MRSPRLEALSDLELLEEIARIAADFRDAITKGDTDWVYKKIRTEGSQLSGELFDALVEKLRRAGTVTSSRL